MDEDVKIMQGQACAGRSDETEVARSLVRSPRPLCAALDTALSEQVSFSAYGGKVIYSSKSASDACHPRHNNR